jgi:hypothetical protein
MIDDDDPSNESSPEESTTHSQDSGKLSIHVIQYVFINQSSAPTIC